MKDRKEVRRISDRISDREANAMVCRSMSVKCCSNPRILEKTLFILKKVTDNIAIV